MDMHIPQALLEAPNSPSIRVSAEERTEFYFSEQLSAYLDRNLRAMWLRWKPSPRPSFNPDLLRDLDRYCRFLTQTEGRLQFDDREGRIEYASPAMQALWGDAYRAGLWRRLWLALMEEQRELGLAIPEAAVTELRAHLDDVDLAAVAQYERRFRHDVMAHVHALGDQAPAARPWLHLGATSAYVADNADLLVMRDGLRLLLGRLVALLRALGAFAERHAALPCLAYTHFQPAQLTTVGKRASLWAQDFALDAEELCHRLETLRFRGCKGTTGTQASFLELFGGDHARVKLYVVDLKFGQIACQIRREAAGAQPDHQHPGRALRIHQADGHHLRVRDRQLRPIGQIAYGFDVVAAVAPERHGHARAMLGNVDVVVLGLDVLQQAVLALEELPRRPVETTPGVRADVEPGPHAVALAMQDQRLGIAIEHHLGLDETAFGDAVKCDQCAGWREAGCVHGLIV